MKPVAENCGPQHPGCDCDVECPTCGGMVGNRVHLCDCSRCADNEIDDEPYCAFCGWVGELNELVPVNTELKRIEQRKLDEWIALTQRGG